MTPIEIAAKAICTGRKKQLVEASCPCRRCLDMANRAIAALEAASFHILSPEATEEMIYTGFNAYVNAESGVGFPVEATAVAVWKAMHAAAPRWSKKK